MILLELGAAAVGGAVVGWVAHALLRGRRKVGAPGIERDTPPSASATRNVVIATPTEATAQAAVPARAVSADADTAGRVILHLARLGRLAYDDVGFVGHTQAGMSEALSIRQGTLTKVLSRLVAAKVVEVDRRHVHGQSRRLNVYRLTALGESVARDIRVRHAAEQSDAVVMVPK